MPIKRHCEITRRMDFDDLIMNTIRLSEDNDEVLTYYQNKFTDYLHVDEYPSISNHAHIHCGHICRLRGFPVIYV